MEKMLYRQESLNLYRKLASIQRKEQGRTIEETLYICDRENYYFSCAVSEKYGFILFGRDRRTLYYQSRLSSDEAKTWIKENFPAETVNQMFWLIEDMFK